jgi:hypothetical protein
LRNFRRLRFDFSHNAIKTKLGSFKISGRWARLTKISSTKKCHPNTSNNIFFFLDDSSNSVLLQLIHALPQQMLESSNLSRHSFHICLHNSQVLASKQNATTEYLLQRFGLVVANQNAGKANIFCSANLTEPNIWDTFLEFLEASKLLSSLLFFFFHSL